MASEIEGQALPLDCTVTYYPGFMAPGEAGALFRLICEDYDPAAESTIRMADGSTVERDTGAILFVDPTLVVEFDEAVWGRVYAWPPLLESLKARVESVAGRMLPVCRCIYYADGKSGCDFHADFPAYGELSCIASISLGEERAFLLRRTEDPSDVTGVTLGHGSLLIMGEGCQERYEHALPEDSRYAKPRINLTFRPFGWERQ